MKMTQVIQHGNVRWKVSWQENGKQHRNFFKTREEALAFYEAKHRPSAYILADGDVMQAKRRADRGGYTLDQACTIYEAFRSAVKERKP